MKRSRQLLTSRGGGELIELQMTIRIEGGSIRSKGRRPRNGTFILPLSPSPVFLPLPTNESQPGKRLAFHRPLITFPQRASIIIRIVFESRAGDPRGERKGVSHPLPGEISKTPRSRILWQNFFEKTFYSASEETRRACKVSTPFHFPTIFLFCLHLPFFSPFMRSGRK